MKGWKERFVDKEVCLGSGARQKLYRVGGEERKEGKRIVKCEQV